MTEIKSDQESIVSIGRQPVFDAKGRLWGYEIFCIDSTGAGLDIPGRDTSINPEPCACASLQQILHGEKKIIIDFSIRGILAGLPYALPPVLGVIEVDEQVGREPSAVETLQRIKTDGYLISIRSFTGNPDWDALYRLANVLNLEAGQRGRDELDPVVAQARNYDALLLASRVPDRKVLEVCKQLGFSLFHGSFFKSPEKMTVRKISSNEALRLNLLRLLEERDPDTNKLAKMIQSDATISYRLLAYLNSPVFGFSRKITSIRQAIILLGWANAKKWLRVLLLTDTSQTRDTHELVMLSAQRGSFLSCVARDHDFWGFDSESLQLLGVFSLLDALLECPMSEIVSHLPIDSRMKAALCGEENNEYLPLLQLAQCLEEARWDAAETMFGQLNLDRKKVLAAFQDSIRWAAQLDSLSSEPAPN
jgi:c-di-GMP phosphodiesterase